MKQTGMYSVISTASRNSSTTKRIGVISSQACGIPGRQFTESRYVDVGGCSSGSSSDITGDTNQNNINVTSSSHNCYGNIRDIDITSKRLVSLIEESHHIVRQLLVDGVPDSSHARPEFSASRDYPAYLPQCECLLQLYKPKILEEVKQLYATDNDDEIIFCLKAFFSSFQRAFLVRPTTSTTEPSLLSMNNVVYVHNGYHCCLPVLLEMMSTEFQNILMMTTDDSRSSSLSNVSKFLANMVQLIKLSGIDSSIHKIAVDFSELLQECELHQLKMYQDD
jgi:hypothetical protein